MPIAPLTVATRVIRPGRNVELVESALHEAGGERRELARATAWRLRRATGVPASPDEPPPAPPEAARSSRSSRPARRPDTTRRWTSASSPAGSSSPARRSSGCGCASRWSATSRRRRSSARSWPPTPATASAPSSTSARYLFINTELTRPPAREPEGEWVCLDAVTRTGPEGVGLVRERARRRARALRPRRPDALRPASDETARDVPRAAADRPSPGGGAAGAPVATPRHEHPALRALGDGRPPPSMTALGRVHIPRGSAPARRTQHEAAAPGGRHTHDQQSRNRPQYERRDEHAGRHVPERPVPPRGPDRVRGDVDRLSRVRHDARAPGRREADAPRDRVGLRPARAVPARGALRRPAQPPAHRRRDRRGRGGRAPLHRLRVRRGRDAEGADPADGPAADRRGDRLRDRDRPRARGSACAPDRPPRHQAPERARGRRGLRQGDRLRHRPLARGGGPDRRRPRPRHDRLRLPRAGARPRRRRPVRPLLARASSSTRCSPGTSRSTARTRSPWR